MQETPPIILCMSRAYRPSGNWQPQEYTRIIYPGCNFQESVACGNPKPWSGHLELLWPQLSVWPNIAVALAGLGSQSLSLLGRGFRVFWVPCYHPEVLLTSCYHATDAPQTQHKNTSCGSKSMFCQWSFASKIQEISRPPNNFWTASTRFSEAMFLVVVYLNLSLPPTLAASNAICRLCKAAEIQTVSQTVQVSCQNGSISGNIINNLNVSCMTTSDVFHAIIFDDSSVYNLPLSLDATEAVEICSNCKWPAAKAS